MADQEQPSLHIDTDWKKQAQEEKRRLAEQEAQRATERDAANRTAAPIPPPGTPAAPSASAGPASPASTSPARGRGASAVPRERQLPEASLPTLVNSLVTQVLLYLGDLTPRGAEPQVNLDMAKFNVDLLGVLEEKTKNNLTGDEQKLLDNALYEARMRFVSVASQYASV